MCHQVVTIATPKSREYIKYFGQIVCKVYMLLIKQYFFPTFKLFQQNKEFSEQQEHAEMQCATGTIFHDYDDEWIHIVNKPYLT